MSKFARFVVLVVSLMSLFAVMSSAAGAVTWTNSGDTAFTATAGSGTLSSTGVTLVCPSASATGTVASSPFVGNVWSAVTGTATYSGCSLAGVSTTVDCGYTLTAASFTAGSPATTTGDADVACGVFQFGTRVCNINGKDHAIYTNPASPAFGKLLLTTGGSLTTGNATGSCPLGNGDSAHLSATTFTINSATGGPTPHLGPIITRS